MTKTPPDLAEGQKWAYNDRRYDSPRYLVITALTDERVYATSNTTRGETSFARENFARGSDWTFCGHEGPGVLPPYSKDPYVALGCAHSANPTLMPLDWPIDPGFGHTEVTRDGEVVWAGGQTEKQVAHVEQWARETPGDWRIRIESAMSERLYQRQEAGWVLVARGMGFA